MVGFREIPEHIGGDGVLVPGMSDSHSYSSIGVADVAVQRSQAVMAGMATALFYAQFAGCQIDFVVEHDYILGRQFVEAHGLTDGLARAVHEGLGFQKGDLYTV